MSEHYSSRDRRRDSRSRSPRRGRDSRPQRSRSRERQRGGRSRSRSRERDRPRSGGYGDRGGDRSRLIRDGGSRGERHPQNGPHSGRERAGERHESERRTVAVEAVASAIRGHMQPGSAEAAALLQPESGEIVDDVVIDAAAMEDIDRFLEGEDEEAEAARIAEERRRRREEILQRHQSESAAQAAPAAPAPASTAADQGGMHVSDSNTDFSAYTSDMKLYGTVSAGVGRPAAAAMEADQSEAEVLQAEQQAVQEEAMKNEPQGFDIFSASPSDQEMAVAGLPKRASSGVLKASVLGDEGGSHLQSNYDDTEGYYKLTIGEVIAGRYRTQGVVGKGVFSTVLKCVDLGTEETVAIKMIRNNDVMRKAAEKELSILTMLSDRDPENKKHCVRLLGHTEYRNHTTFVFESLQMNLRDALKKFGKNVGINVGAIRMYGRQLFVALKFLSDLQIVHADIKLDNILVSDDLKQVKICDFGSAFLESDPDRDPTPYLVSRFYRAPEIILGLQYDRMVDMFSVGTCLYELFTGHVMLPGRTNNDMLRLMQAFKGRLPNKILKSHVRSYEKLGLDPHFDTDFKFKHWDQDPVTGKPVLRLMDILQPTKDLSAILLSSKAGADDRNRVLLLADLIHKTIALDPSKRIDPVEAFKHPFFTAKDKAP